MKSIVPCSRKALPTIAVAMMLWAPVTVRAAFHLWNIREVYTDASGTLQYIEFFTSASSQQFVAGQSISVTPTGGGAPHVFTIPSNLPGDTTSHAFLIGTAAADAAGAPTPDYIIPTNFLFSGGGTISFWGANSGPYTALPTDGVMSRTWGDGNANNTPQNFAGQIGFVVPPSVPPSISITNPPDNSLFAAPATVPVGVSASDSDGSVANVRLLTNGVAAATNAAAPFGFTLANLPAGNYTLRAVAQDNSSLSTTSAPVTIRVADRPVLVVGPGVGGPIQFQFNSRTGVNYIVERATPLTGFSPVATNPGSGGSLQFQETDASASQRAYRVRLE